MHRGDALKAQKFLSHWSKKSEVLPRSMGEDDREQYLCLSKAFEGPRDLGYLLLQ